MQAHFNSQRRNQPWWHGLSLSGQNLSHYGISLRGRS
jgi:hypothetical protein